MHKLFVQLCGITLLLLMRKLFQTGSPCFPLNSEIHNLTRVTVIFGWCCQPVLHTLKLSLAFHALKWCLEWHQRSNMLSSAGCRVNKSFPCWKKKELRLAERFFCFQYCTWELLAIILVLLEPFLLTGVFLLWFTFSLKKMWSRYGVLRLVSKQLLGSWLTSCHGASSCT